MQNILVPVDTIVIKTCQLTTKNLPFGGLAKKILVFAGDPLTCFTCAININKMFTDVFTESIGVWVVSEKSARKSLPQFDTF